MKVFYYFLSVLLALFLLSNIALAQKDSVDLSKLPELLGANNVGTDFWFSIPPCFEEESAGNGSFVKVFVTSSVQTTVTLEVPGKSYFQQKNSIPNDVIAFDLIPSIGEPVTKLGRHAPIPEQVYTGYGIHVSSNDPIVVYCVVRFMATSDGFIAIPVSSLGNEYIVQAYKEDPMFHAVWNYKLPSTTNIVAPFDDTEVTFTMGGNQISKTGGGLNPGESTTVTMNHGDVWMFMSAGDGGDLSGSKVIANKPISVVSGNQCTNIPVGNQWCDYSVEMNIPTNTWGNYYHVGKVPGRKNPSIVRIFAKEPNTIVYKNGLQVGIIPQAGGIEGQAFLEMRMGAMGSTVTSAVFHADKPIGITKYNCGVQEDGYPLPSSDPFTETQVPVEQYEKEITFCTPSTFGGASFAENYINLIYETDQNQLMPDDMEFAQVYAGDFTWEPINSKFPGLSEQFSYDVNGKHYALKTISLPTTGVFKIRAQQPFAAYSFGYDWCDSYGYPTAGAYMDMNCNKDNTPPSPFWKIDTSGNVSGSVEESGDASNKASNLSMVTMYNDQSYNYSFDHGDFIPGADASTWWELKLQDQTKNARAVLIFSDRRGNDTIVVLKHKGTKVEVDETNLPDFDLVAYPSPAQNTLNVTYNLGNQANVSISIIGINGELIDTPVQNRIQETGSQKLQINTSKYLNGTYFIRIETPSKNYSAKFTVNH